MFGNLPPFFQALSLAAIKTWLQDQALTLTSTLTINKTAAASAGENIFEAKVSDNASDTLLLSNNTTTDATFTALWTARATGANICLDTLGMANTDSGSSPILRFRGRTVAGAAITTRPLFGFNNLNTEVLSGLPLNSGANLALSWGTQAGGLPNTGSRNNGTRGILYSAFSGGTATDYAFGVDNSVGAYWMSVPQATSSYGFRFYGAGTLSTYIRGDGLLDTTGAVRATGVSAPSTGSGVELLYGIVADTGDVIAYNRTGSTWRDLRVRGLTVALQASGSTVLTAASTAVTAAVPVGFKSYTVATLPSAATAGQMIFVSDESGGAVMAFSDGTNWRRVTDRAIVS